MAKKYIFSFGLILGCILHHGRFCLHDSHAGRGFDCTHFANAHRGKTQVRGSCP